MEVSIKITSVNIKLGKYVYYLQTGEQSLAKLGFKSFGLRFVRTGSQWIAGFQLGYMTYGLIHDVTPELKSQFGFGKVADTWD
jgi:hypothetical protein